ncbi:MAG: winged helix-turn-helix domain-containing protein [Deltaproteobacteria bacterium]|nr:winged helix-turn-helix domain-containing protein [Deltaproteobacteria bacterium]
MDTEKSLEAMKRLRHERGVRPEALERSRRATRTWKAIREALSGGELSVPELAAKTGLPTGEVFWYLNALRKYGEAEIAGEADSYLRYRRVTRT